MAEPRSLTGQYLSGAKTIPVPPAVSRATATASPSGGRGKQPGPHRRFHPPGDLHLRHRGVRVGKSSLVNEILFKRLGADLNRMKVRPGKHDRLEGEEFLDKVIAIDQSPIGRTPRSNPATYTGLFGGHPGALCLHPDAKSRGTGPGRFSLQREGGPVRVLRRRRPAED